MTEDYQESALFHVRQIEETDVKGFHAALDSVARERKFLLTLEAPAIECTRQFVRENICNHYAQYVAEEDGQIVGWADIIPERAESQAHVGELGMGVVAEQRGCGIGKALLRRAMRHAWDAGLIRIELEVFCSNRPAIALYENFGFVHEGKKRKARCIDGRYEDVYIMGQCHI